MLRRFCNQGVKNHTSSLDIIKELLNVYKFRYSRFKFRKSELSINTTLIVYIYSKIFFSFCFNLFNIKSLKIFFNCVIPIFRKRKMIKYFTQRRWICMNCFRTSEYYVEIQEFSKSPLCLSPLSSLSLSLSLSLIGSLCSSFIVTSAII